MVTIKPYTPATSGVEAKRWAALARSPRQDVSRFYGDDVRCAAQITNILHTAVMSPPARLQLAELRDGATREATFLAAVLGGYVDTRYLDEIAVSEQALRGKGFGDDSEYGLAENDR